MEIFDFDVGIGSSSEVKFDVRTVKFGNGYEQRQPVGISPAFEDWSCSVVGKKKDVDKIKAFLERHKDGKAFKWRVTPDEPLKKYKVEGYRRTPKGGNKWEIRWKMKEVRA